jgi:hypothetical protein
MIEERRWKAEAAEQTRILTKQIEIAIEKVAVAEAKVAEANRLRAIKKDLLANLGVPL